MFEDWVQQLGLFKVSFFLVGSQSALIVKKPGANKFTHFPVIYDQATLERVF